MRTIQIRLADDTGKVYRWRIERIPRAINCTTFGTRVISGWQFVDHDGTARFSEGTWLDLVPMVKLTAENYGFKLLSGLS